MRRTRNLYSQDELDFIVKEAKRVSPDELHRAGSHVARLHREIAPAKKWPRRSSGSITNKLWCIHTGRHTTNLEDQKQRVRNRVGAHMNGAGETAIQGAYAVFNERLKKANEEYEREKRAAKTDLQKAINAL